MRKFYKALCTIIASAMVVTMTPVISFAEDFASATELLTDVVTTSIMDIESSTKDTALTGTLAKITVDGEAVSYEGEIIGYWDVSTPNTLYADAEKSSKVIDKTAEGYDVNPVLLSTILTDLNAELKDSYTPTDMTDWSQIIGKYDITFGEGALTIPAEQWVTLPERTYNGATSDIPSTQLLNLSEITGLSFDSDYNGAENLRFGFYRINQEGKLFIANAAVRLYFPTKGILGIKTVSLNQTMVPSVSGGTISGKNGLNIYVARNQYDSSYYFGDILVADSFRTSGCVRSISVAGTTGNWYTEFNINNLSEQYGKYDTAVDWGIYWYTQDTISDSEWQEMHSSMIVSQSASKTVVGNTDLSKKILKLNTLSETDTLSVTSTDWLVNSESIADFLGAEFITESGSSATIDTPTEIEPMAFNVVVPASLPIYVDSQNTVFVADNAVISNYSCAPVAVKSVEITPKPNSGWQMVDTEPSPNRDSMEFTFATSLTPGTILGVDENVSFTYSAKLSPYTVGTASLDLATVNVTVCWADELTP